MSFPFRAGLPPLTFSGLVEVFRSTVERFPDERTGDNVEYSMADAAIGAFSVFFTQSPSFLDFQRNLEVTKGCSNARSLFGMTRTPSDNHIRNLLDPVPPDTVFSLFSCAVDALHALGHLEPYRSINGDLLMAMDGTEYFSSSKIHCENCRVTEHKNGTLTYSHTVLTPVIVAPGNPRVIPLEPEFVTPQDGHHPRLRPAWIVSPLRAGGDPRRRRELHVATQARGGAPGRQLGMDADRSAQRDGPLDGRLHRAAGVLRGRAAGAVLAVSPPDNQFGARIRNLHPASAHGKHTGGAPTPMTTHPLDGVTEIVGRHTPLTVGGHDDVHRMAPGKQPIGHGSMTATTV
jgi:hypothetical protein